MGMHEERHAKEAVVSEFPPGLRVLAIDNDPVSLEALEILMCMRNYRLTIARDEMTTLRMLREGRDNFDLVISDVYMSNMDGFKLLKLIDLEMDLPVIVLSANEQPEAIVKAIAYGACGYLVKPVQTNDLNIMWQQVISRRSPDPLNFCSSIANAVSEKAQPTGGAADGEQGGAESTKHGWTESHEHDGDGQDANKENVSPNRSTGKRPRTTWSNELHGKFVEAVRQIGIKRAVPSKIRAAMNVDNISRDIVGSHLQKYRTNLKSAEDRPEERRNLFAAERWDLSRGMLEEGIKYYHGHGMYHPSAFEARGTGVHGGGMLFRDVAPGSSSLLRGVRQRPSSSSSYANRGESSYMGVLRSNLLGANRGIRSSGTSFADRKRNRGSHQFPVQPSGQLGLQPLVQRTPYGDTGNCLGNSWQAGMKYPDLSRDYWRMTPGLSQAIIPNTSRDYWRMTPGPSQANIPNTSRDHWRMTPGPSQANIPNINQLTGLAASPAGQIAGHIPMSLDELQNQIAAFLNSTTSMAGSGEEMAPFDVDVTINNNTGSIEMMNGNFAIDGNTSSVEMLNGNFTLGSASTIGAALPDLEMGTSAPTQMLNGGGAGGVLPVQAQGTANQEAVDSQLNINSDEFWEFGDFSMDRIFAITNMLNEDLAINEVNIIDGDL